MILYSVEHGFKGVPLSFFRDVNYCVIRDELKKGLEGILQMS